MKYYRLLDNLDDRWFLKAPDFKEGKSIWDFVTIGQVSELPYIPKAKIRDKGRRVNITFADFDLLIVDSLAKAIFHDTDVQFHPILVEDNNKSQDYSIMTIIHGFDCLNEELSSFDKYEQHDEIRPDLAGNYKTIYKMKIDPKKVGDCDIFRLSKYEVAIIVSEKLKNKLVKEKISGVKFREV
jgi:hypothetical protein